MFIMSYLLLISECSNSFFLLYNYNNDKASFSSSKCVKSSWFVKVAQSVSVMWLKVVIESVNAMKSVRGQYSFDTGCSVLLRFCRKTHILIRSKFLFTETACWVISPGVFQRVRVPFCLSARNRRSLVRNARLVWSPARFSLWFWFRIKQPCETALLSTHLPWLHLSIGNISSVCNCVCESVSDPVF